MIRSDRKELADLAGITVPKEELDALNNNIAYKRINQAVVDVLDSMHDAIVTGGISRLGTEYLRGQIAALTFFLELPKEIKREVDADKTHPIRFNAEELAEQEKAMHARYHKQRGDENNE